MLGIGMQEMLIIGIAALLIFGPGKLPEVMGQAGKLYRDFRKMTDELTGEFQKTVAEAQDVASSLTGEMQKEVNSVTASVKRDLGAGSKVTNTSSLKKSGSSSSTKKTTSTSKSSSRTTTSSTRSSASSASKSSRTATSSTSTSSKAAARPAVPVASKEEPDAGISLFEPTAPERERRVRRATPSVITDPTPRHMVVDLASDMEEAGAASADDPLARARQRRRNAGYARRSA